MPAKNSNTGQTVLSNQPNKSTWTVYYRLEADTAQSEGNPKYTNY